MKLDEERLRGEWELRGPLARHGQFVDAMVDDPDILELKY
jgi:hypothetical protein